MNNPFLLCLTSLMAVSITAGESISRYNVIWNSPSKDASGQMPLGNGDVAAGVYAVEGGDLYLLLSKNDAYTYNGDLFKTGRVHISIKPNPFEKGKAFKQTLDLTTGSIRIDADGVKIKLWADANRNVYHVEIDSPQDVAVSTAPELWKRFDDCAYNTSRAPLDEPTQDVRLEKDGRIICYYNVGDRSVYPEELKYYSVEHMADKFPDPYRFNIFGNLTESPDMALTEGALQGSGRTFDIRIHARCQQEPKVDRWVAALEKQAAEKRDTRKDWEQHCRWWSDFWDKSWITVSDNTVPAEEREKFSGESVNGRRIEKDAGALVAQNYNVFRFLMACQSRGRVQTKFNGGLFTQPLLTSKPGKKRSSEKLGENLWMTHEDARDWGRRFTYQNQRLLYWPLLMSGDFELMQPFFNYYSDLLPLRKAITQAWFGHEGAYYRENIEPTGGERDCGDGKPPKTKPGENAGKGYYHSYYFTSGLETTAMMIDYAKYSGDKKFADQVLVPFAREVLLFFDKHYLRDPEGKIRLDPAMVLETWWVAVNPAPDIAGLQYCLDELLAMQAGTKSDQRAWKRFRAEIPPVHLQEINGLKAIAPAQEWSHKKNSENGELYPVFPFRCFGLGLGTSDIVSVTMTNRASKNSYNYKCWTQDQIHWAYAGDAAEAKDGLIHRYRHASTECRFPMYGSAGPDSCPDFDHFGSGSIALQRMLLQEAGGKILLLPAWPAEWDADFKLHLEGQTVVSGIVKKGRLEKWDIQPAARKKDVVVYQPQKVPKKPAIPANNHPLRIGVDSEGKSLFRGTFGRVTAFRGALKQEDVRKLATGGHDRAVEGSNVIFSVLSPVAGGTLTDDQKLFAGDFSFELWIKPAKGESGRILDKLTAGKNDGFLIDCWNNQSLRVITAAEEKKCTGVLKADTWQHVVVVFAESGVSLWLNGEEL